MSTKTKIEWTEATWNPIRGCSRVSEGCRNCYAEHVAARFSLPGQAYEGLARLVHIGKGDRRRTEAQWTGEVRLIEKHLEDPLRWKTPRRIFVNSMSDLFHEKVEPQWIARVFAVMAIAHWHTFQILTKRPHNMLRTLSEEALGRAFRELVANFVDELIGVDPESSLADDIRLRKGWPLPNVHLGVSVEDQATANARIPLLVETPAAIRFISYEPALGPVTLSDCWTRFSHPSSLLDWVICGGESGPKARPMHPQWARSMRDQCLAADVPFFFKQWGEFLPALQDGNPQHKGGQHLNCSNTHKRIGKKAAGRLLDGREWNQYPREIEIKASEATA